jgi:hypothetical protein
MSDLEVEDLGSLETETPEKAGGEAEGKHEDL